MLEWEHLDIGMDLYVELCKDLCWEFTHKFDVSKKFNNYLDYWDHVKWLNNIVTTNTINGVRKTFEVLFGKKGNEEYDEFTKDLLEIFCKCKLHARSILGVEQRQ